MCRYVTILAVGYGVVFVSALGQYVVPMPTAAGPACMVHLERQLPQRVTAAEDNKTCSVFLPHYPQSQQKKRRKMILLLFVYSFINYLQEPTDIPSRKKINEVGVCHRLVFSLL